MSKNTGRRSPPVNKSKNGLNTMEKLYRAKFFQMPRRTGGRRICEDLAVVSLFNSSTEARTRHRPRAPQSRAQLCAIGPPTLRSGRSEGLLIVAHARGW